MFRKDDKFTSWKYPLLLLPPYTLLTCYVMVDGPHRSLRHVESTFAVPRIPPPTHTHINTSRVAVRLGSSALVDGRLEESREEEGGDGGWSCSRRLVQPYVLLASHAEFETLPPTCHHSNILTPSHHHHSTTLSPSHHHHSTTPHPHTTTTLPHHNLTPPPSHHNQHPHNLTTSSYTSFVINYHQNHHTIIIIITSIIITSTITIITTTTPSLPSTPPP